MFATHGGAAAIHDGSRAGATGRVTRPTTIQILTHAHRGELVPHAAENREYVRAELRRAGERARELGDDEGAERAALVLGLLALALGDPTQ